MDQSISLGHKFIPTFRMNLHADLYNNSCTVLIITLDQEMAGLFTVIEFFSLHRSSWYPHLLKHFLHSWYMAGTVLNTEDPEMVEILPLFSRASLDYSGDKCRQLQSKVTNLTREIVALLIDKM